MLPDCSSSQQESAHVALEASMASCPPFLQQGLEQAGLGLCVATMAFGGPQQDPTHPLFGGSGAGLIEQHASAQLFFAMGPLSQLLCEKQASEALSSIEGCWRGLLVEQQDAAQSPLMEGALGDLFSEQQEPGHLVLLASFLGVLSLAVSDPEQLVLAAAFTADWFFEQQESAQLLFGGGSLVGFPSE
ncbi:hypothetical protein NM208_g12290 [Fusarium decemcellulare]|uniref:Uncharacterized protein n=1 Tax=Fusarium decemcellulare TaxID=57161 RepID=A0ACC1RTI0_9HYPO|nr:hypothetical protein NM208_g12290 [Fusarium decemcellulare]